MTTIALAGNPNAGKTTLFNRLTGLRQKVGNYPGVTVERRSGRATFGDREISVVDLPGTYSLIARSRDEAIAFEYLRGRQGQTPDAIIAVVDASNLERNLYLVLALLELGLPVVVALNMMDELRRAGHVVDVSALSEALGVPVVPISAHSGEGVEDLQETAAQAIRAHAPARAAVPEHLQAPLAPLADSLPGGWTEAAWVVGSLAALDPQTKPEDEDHPLHDWPDVARHAERASEIIRAHPGLPGALIEARYARAREIAKLCWSRGSAERATTTDRVDAWLLHPVAGTAAFAVVMFALFQSIFTWAAPFMDALEAGMGAVQSSLSNRLPRGALTDLLTEGVIGGVGNVLVFIPQIAFLFLFISILEDSGYLARAAYLSDRAMSRVGLHGKAFVPLLSGFACAIPAIMAARSIESRRDRLVTILVTPLMTCSARLPVFVLVIGALFAGTAPVLGFFSLGGLMLFAMYVLSVIAAIASAFVLKRTILSSPTPPLVLELPPYRLPRLQDVLRRVASRCWVFVKDAGSIILAITIVLWAMTYFPRPDDASPGSTAVEQSFAGQIGHAIEPIIEPLGYDWRIGVGLLASFAAREVFVSTMALVFDRDTDDAEDPGLRAALRAAKDSDGNPLYTPLVGLSIMIFFLFAAQCMSTIAVIRRETQSWRWPLFALVYMNVLAYVSALIVYQGGRALGWG